MLDAMAGPVVGDPAWAPPLLPGETFLGWAARPPGRLRIGRTTESAIADAELEPEVAAALDSTARLLADLGHEVEDVPGGLLGPEVLPSFERTWALSATTLPVNPDQVAQLGPLTRELRERGLRLTARDAMEA